MEPEENEVNQVGPALNVGSRVTWTKSETVDIPAGTVLTVTEILTVKQRAVCALPSGTTYSLKIAELVPVAHAATGKLVSKSVTYLSIYGVVGRWERVGGKGRWSGARSEARGRTQPRLPPPPPPPTTSTSTSSSFSASSYG